MAKILIADDERRLLEILERVLGKRGHDVETFGDGASAVESIEGGEYDLVLTDLRMPGKSGLEVLTASRRVRPRTPVVILSGASEPEDRARAEAAGVYMLLHKPVDLAYLMTIIDSALDREAAALPAEREAKAPPRPAPPPGPPARIDERAEPLGVRVIDHEACLENMIAYCLKKQGFRVLSGPGTRPPAIAVVGLLGAVESVRRDAPEAVIVALHALSSPEDAVRALEAGADVALARPFEPEVLFAHVRAAARRLLARSAPAAPAALAPPAAASAAPGAGPERPVTRNRLTAARG